VEVIFAPQTPGAKGATITVSSDDADQGVLDVALGGLAVSGAADIVSAEMTFDSANLYFHVAFVPGTFDINDYRFVLHLDADQDPGTGLNPVGIGSTLRDDIGLDFYVASDTMPSSSFGGPGFAKVYAPHVGVVDEVSFAYGMDFLSFSVPLSSLGNDDGVVNYVFSAADSIKDNFVTNADHVPNTGLGVSTGTNASSTPDIEVKDSIVPIDDAQMPFGSLNEGTRSAPEILSIRNNGTGDLLIQDMMVTGNDAQDMQRGGDFCTADARSKRRDDYRLVR
jgi:hypothetical protein